MLGQAQGEVAGARSALHVAQSRLAVLEQESQALKVGQQMHRGLHTGRTRAGAGGGSGF